MAAPAPSNSTASSLPLPRSLAVLALPLAPLVAALAVHQDASDQRSAWTWLVAVLVCAIGLATAWPRDWRPGLHRGAALLAGGWLAAGLWYRASAWWGVLPGATRFEAARLLGGLACAVLAWLLARRCAAGPAIVGLVLLATAFVAVSGIVDAGWSGIDHQVRESGWVGYWNTMALLCAWLALGAAALVTQARTRPGRFAGVLVAAVAGVGMGVTASRGALAAAVLVLIVAAVVRRRSSFSVSVLVGALTTSIPVLAIGTHTPTLLILLLLPLAWAALPDRGGLDRSVTTIGVLVVRTLRTVGGRIVAVVGGAAVLAGLIVVAIHAARSFTSNAPLTNATVVSRLSSASGDFRWVWWKEAAREFWHHALIGQGGEAFRVYHLEHRMDSSLVLQPHSLPLQLLVDGGVVLGLLGLASLVGLGMLTWAVRARPHAVLAAGMIWVCVLQALVDWTLQFPVVVVCVALLAGVMAAAADPHGGPRLPVRGHPARWVGGALAVICALISVVPAVAVQLERSAENASPTGHATAAEWLARASFALVPQPTSMATSMDAIDTAQGHAAALTWINQHVGRVANEETTWSAVGELAISWHDTPLVERTARVARALDPKLYASRRP